MHWDTEQLSQLCYYIIEVLRGSGKQNDFVTALLGEGASSGLFQNEPNRLGVGPKPGH